jgi:hypothetical protein
MTTPFNFSIRIPSATVGYPVLAIGDNRILAKVSKLSTYFVAYCSYVT